MLQSARAFVSSSWQPQLVLYCSGLCHGAMPHCVSHDLFACCAAAPLCPGTAKLSARTQLERDGVHPPDFSGARRRVSSVRRWSLQLSRQRGEPGALHSCLGRQPSYQYLLDTGSYRRYEGLFIQRRGGGHRGVRTPSPGYHHPRPEGRITRPRNTTEEKKARSYNLAQHDSEIRHFIRKSSRRRPNYRRPMRARAR